MYVVISFARHLAHDTKFITFHDLVTAVILVEG